MLAGGTTVVEVSLVNPQLLMGEDEAVEVSFTTEVVTIVGEGDPGLRLTRAMPGMSVIIGAAYDVPLTAGEGDCVGQGAVGRCPGCGHAGSFDRSCGGGCRASFPAGDSERGGDPFFTVARAGGGLDAVASAFA